MRKFASLLILSTLASPLARAQSSTIRASQTARQALMEMFSLTTQGTFVKHLPAATLSALEKSGALQTLQQYSTLTTQLHSTGNQLETFETGPVLLTSLDPKTNLKVEVIVDSDSQQGEDDNIVLTFRTYKDKDKEVQRTPFMPRITFAMKMESGVWKLNEILVTIRLPLADPDFLKSITDGIKSRTATPAIQPQIQLTQSPSIQTQSIQGQAIQNQPVPWQPGTQNHGFDNSIQTAMRSILTAEIAYSATYRAVGYTCTLSDLDGFGGGEPTEHQAMLIPSGLASGKKFGYVFSLSGCAGRPATGFQLVAAPAGNSLGRRAFCADQSGAIRYSADGNPATCLASGTTGQ
ncbi:MAG: hypothetical protein WB762_33910 [Candidatus Sulfotelmatobacter sp.]